MSNYYWLYVGLSGEVPNVIGRYKINSVAINISSPFIAGTPRCHYFEDQLRYCQVNVNHALYEAKYPFSTARNQ